MALATDLKVGLSSLLLVTVSCLAKVLANHFLTSSGTVSLSSSDKSGVSLPREMFCLKMFGDSILLTLQN